MSFPRNNNPIYKTLTRSNSSMIDGNSSNENIIPQIFNEIHELSKQVISLQNSHNELIKILSPMFPRDTSEHTSIEAINDAVLSGKYSILLYVFNLFFPCIYLNS